MNIIYIGITGSAGAGKDQLAKFMNEILYDRKKYEVARIAFADALKRTLSEMYGCPVRFFNDRSYKEKPCDHLDGKTPREVMQNFGTEVVRNMNKDHWINRLIQESERHFQNTSSDNMKVVIIPDARFENERDFVIKSGGSMIFIERADPDVGDIDSKHSSETESGLEYDYDFYIANDLSLSHLKLAAGSILNSIGLI